MPWHIRPQATATLKVIYLLMAEFDIKLFNRLCFSGLVKSLKTDTMAREYYFLAKVIKRFPTSGIVWP
jgi:hypothetical protein